MKFTGDVDPVIDQLAAQERAAYREVKEAEERLKKAKSALIEEIKARGGDPVPWGDQKITIVEAERVKVDEDLLKELVPATVWEAVTLRKVSNPLLTQALLDGVLDADSIEKAITITKNSPYPSYSAIGDDE